METRIITWNEPGFSPEESSWIKETIGKGELIAFPTETVYGLGGDGFNPGASQKIYQAKGRPSDNPLILHISDLSMLSDIAREIPDVAYILAEKFWPGPLTMIFKKKAEVPVETTGGLFTVAVRMPDHPAALAMIQMAETPIAAPSANLSGKPSPTRMEHVTADLGGKIAGLIDGGEVGIGYESTIVDLTEKEPLILRPGYITAKMLEETLGNVEKDPGLEGEGRPKAPGMRYRHYAPKAEMVVFYGTVAKQKETIRNRAEEYLKKGYREDEIGILATRESKQEYPVGRVLCCGSRQDDTMGHDLYHVLREFDGLGVRVILSEGFDDSPKAEALMNRMRKASGNHMIKVDME